MSQTSASRKRKAAQLGPSSSSTAHEHNHRGNEPLLELGLAQIDASNSDNDENEALDDQDTDSTGDSLNLAADELFPEHAASDDEDREFAFSTYRVEEDANGNQRFVYPEIDPVYDSDDSDAKEAENTIGDIPLSFYDSYPHIGYDVNGKKIMRPAKGAALDSLLDSIEIPTGWTGLTDPATGKPLQLSPEELDVLKRLTRNEAPEDGYDQYPEMVEWFSSQTEQMPLSAAPEPKRRFVPSKHEAKRIMKIVRAIKEGRIQPYRPTEFTVEDEDSLGIQRYDLWANEAPQPDHPMHVPAPKLPPPGYQESYHPPPEYLPDPEEQKAWLALDEEERHQSFLPQDHGSLRKTPGYGRLVQERFERSLDLYLAPRVRRSKLNIDPESLLPKLPSPEELRPFPSRQDMVMRGHNGRVRTAAIDPHGEYLATGGDDGVVKIWWLPTGYQLWSCRLSDQDAIAVVSWRPVLGSLIIAACAGEHVFMIAPALPVLPLHDADPTKVAQELLQDGFAFQRTNNGSAGAALGVREAIAKWRPPESKLRARGVVVQITLRSAIKQMSWHRRGGYFATVAPQGQSNAVAIHTLAKHLTQLPFRRLKGLPQAVRFHPSKPIFFVATQRMIRSYDLAKQELLKTLQPGTRWISSFDVHPGGDNLIVASYDKKLLWMDLDLSTRPYKTLRYHSKAIRSAAFHQGGYPLFADCSDDGSVQVFHGKVVGDLMENANIVPLRVLRGHRVASGLGVLSMEWFPSEPWLVSTGADGTIRTWHS